MKKSICYYCEKTYEGDLDYCPECGIKLYILQPQKTFEVKKKADSLKEYFRILRFSKDHHLGSGDIRLTIGQQNIIIDYIREKEEE